MTMQPPSRLLTALLGGAALVTGLPAGACAAEWRFEPALAPAPPPGGAPAPYRVALGRVGDIEFWAPNRGVLITAGTQAAGGIVPMGVYAYDGADWHQLSTVCGGNDGRIAWAGPEEFWTISDQRPGQVTSGTNSLWNVSLCHFKEGRVVGSYAMPLEQPNSYRPMNAAVCRTANDCWFAGARAPRPGRGGFHLRWDGTNVTAVLSPQDHAIADLAAMPGQLYESVQLAADDVYDGEDQTAPPLLHTIAPPGSSTLFRNVVPADPACAGEVVCPPLPDLGSDANGLPVWPATLSGLTLGSDWSPSGSFAGTPQLWAVAGVPRGVPQPPAGRGIGHPIALRLSGGAWTQVVPRLGTFPGGWIPRRIAALPGRSAAWVGFEVDGDAGGARVARLSASGELTGVAQLGPDQGVGARGATGPIACPGPDDCWLATTTGWLFHLTDGSAQPRDTSASFAGVITFRPPDDGVPFAVPDDPPPDDSLLNQAPPPPPLTVGGDEGGSDPGNGRRARRSRPLVLVRHASTRLVHGTTLRMTFTLTARARVQLVALRRTRVVARSRRQAMRPGRRAIVLRLDRRRWPTKLDLRATPIPTRRGAPRR